MDPLTQGQNTSIFVIGVRSTTLMKYYEIVESIDSGFTRDQEYKVPWPKEKLGRGAGGEGSAGLD